MADLKQFDVQGALDAGYSGAQVQWHLMKELGYPPALAKQATAPPEKMGPPEAPRTIGMPDDVPNPLASRGAPPAPERWNPGAGLQLIGDQVSRLARADIRREPEPSPEEQAIRDTWRNSLPPAQPLPADATLTDPGILHRAEMERQLARPQGMVDAFTGPAIQAAQLHPAGQLLAAGLRTVARPSDAPKIAGELFEADAPMVGRLGAQVPLRTDITAEEILKAAAEGPGKFGSYSKYMERNPTAGEALFDSSNPQPTFPNRPPVARYDPSEGRGRGPSARVVDAFNNPKVINGLKQYARLGAKKLPADWYANDPLLKVYQEEWGPRAEEKFYQQMGHQAATSTGSAVPDNLRTGSLYNYMHEQGIDFPYPPPKGYGSKYQVAHRDTALNFRDTGTVDPIANPKRASFTENLMGNEDLLTADKHFMRLVGILSEDPRFLKTTARVSRSGKEIDIKPQELFKRGELTMAEAVKDPNLWVEAPNDNEYLHLEQQYRNKVAKPLKYTVANAQGKDWVGGGEVTGLGSPPETWIELVKHRVQYTADRLNVDPQVILRKFVRGEIPLLELGGAAAGLGALGSMGQPQGQAEDTDRTRTGGRAGGLR